MSGRHALAFKSQAVYDLHSIQDYRDLVAENDKNEEEAEISCEECCPDKRVDPIDIYIQSVWSVYFLDEAACESHDAVGQGD